MNIETRLQLLRTEKAKILGYARSHLRNVAAARRLYDEIEKKMRKQKFDLGSAKTLQIWLWNHIAERCDELLRRENFQFRMFDEGAIAFLDRDFIKREGNLIDNQVRYVRESVAEFPGKAQDVLRLHYERGMPCQDIAREISVPVEEVYQLWQHSMIFLWEAAENGSHPGFHGPEDESFWTFALRYLDGTASEKFVAELNSEIHVNKSRTREYNNLRIVDGVMIECGRAGFFANGEEEAPIEAEVSSPPRRSIGEKLAPAREKLGGLLAGTASTLGEASSAASGQVQSFLGRLRPDPARRSERSAEQAPPAQVRTPESRPEPEPAAVRAPEPKGEARPVSIRREPPRRREKLPSSMEPAGGFLPERLQRDPLVFFAALAVVLLAAGLVGAFIGWTNEKPRIVRAVGLEFDSAPFGGSRLGYGDHEMTAGTLRFQTRSGLEATVEGPARFAIRSANRLFLGEGRVVAAIPERSGTGAVVETARFQLHTEGGEVGVIGERGEFEVVVFYGNAELAVAGGELVELPPGSGVRFTRDGEMVEVSSQDEAHRFPEFIPVIEPRAYGENLIVNDSFEVGTLSRSCKTERLYRDIPLGWEAGWSKDGQEVASLEQHSGTVMITDAIGGLPAPVHGERYLWINHGYVSQPLRTLEPGARYELSVKVASHRSLGPGGDHLVKNVGGNTFKFGVWDGEKWLAETSGQLEAGQPFQELAMEFDHPLPEPRAIQVIPVLMLIGETRIFFDEVVLRQIGVSQTAPEKQNGGAS